jgi:hypothetical protein
MFNSIGDIFLASLKYKNILGYSCQTTDQPWTYEVSALPSPLIPLLRPDLGTVLDSDWLARDSG